MSREVEALVEREAELGSAGAALEGVAAGTGGVISVEGPAGIGKTALIAALVERASDEGFAIRTARGSELEIDYAFGVVRQLFEGAVAELGADVALAGSAAPAASLFEAAAAPAEAVAAGNVSFAVLHGLYWMALNVAGDEPLLLVVDDLQWCDRPSLRFLAYVANRLDGTRIGLLTGYRSTEPGVDPALVAGIAAGPATTVISPRPLSLDGIGALIERRFERPGDAEFSDACRRASGGNPLLLEQTLEALAMDGRSPTARDAAAVTDVGSRAVSRTVIARLRGLPPEAGEVARAVAILGDGSDVATVARYADREPEAIAESTAALARAGILAPRTPLEFAHPLVRAAIVEDVPPGERELAHARAARLMRELEAAPERVAAQLLAAPPVAEPWAAEVLDRAAQVAVASGAADSAVTYLTRMLAEPIESERRPGVLLQLGMAEAGTGGVAAPGHLLEAYRELDVPELRVAAAYALARVLLFVGEPQRAAELAAGAQRELAADAPDLIPIVESVELISIYFGADVPDAEERFRRLRELPADPSPGESVLAAAASYDWLYRGGSAEECAALASAAIERAAQMEVDTGLTWIVANVVLVAAERPEALEVWDRALARSHRQGSMFGVMSVQLWRGFTELHHGELEDAELSLRAGVEQIRLLGGSTLHYAYGLLASTLIRRGRVEDAERELHTIERPEGIGDGALVWKVAEIELLLERGRDEEALAAAERHVELCGWRVNPAFAPGRRLPARALVRLDRAGEAAEALREDLELAELWGAPGTVGRALAQLGELRGPDGIEDLERGVELLDASPLKLDRARALAALGGALRRSRRPSDARDPLRRAYELAEACGAEPLAAEIRTELHATGARPRSSALSGPDSLTASERRVADIAADGKTNKQIAQELFVTPKTVEVHLSNAYRKLDISGRRELAGALAGD
ncbi:MAG TPA: AAA family ATPase [Solirubrobacterales bacterium]|nr:AAA family ATPase [Solirubrobacterales bacterium]